MFICINGRYVYTLQCLRRISYFISEEIISEKNELSDNIDRPILSKKIIFRVLKYLRDG